MHAVELDALAHPVHLLPKHLLARRAPDLDLVVHAASLGKRALSTQAVRKGESGFVKLRRKLTEDR
jgi:hypothetical protein